MTMRKFFGVLSAFVLASCGQPDNRAAANRTTLVHGYPSPDGKWIAYTKSVSGKPTVWLWDREKKTQRQLTTEGFEALSYRCFSPDSRSLLYTSTL